MNDQLFFLSVTGERQYVAEWIGAWPPPERMTLARGHASGQVSVIDPSRAQAMEAARRLGSITFHTYRLRNCSKIEHKPGPGDHWFRGAEYVPEADDA